MTDGPSRVRLTAPHPMPGWVVAIPVADEAPAPEEDPERVTLVVGQPQRVRPPVRTAIVAGVGATPGWDPEFDEGAKILYLLGSGMGAFCFELDGYVYVQMQAVVAWEPPPATP